jgi:hypothetical protein
MARRKNREGVRMRGFLIRCGLALLVLFGLSTKFVDLTIGAGFGSHPSTAAWAATGVPAEGASFEFWLAAPAMAAGQDLREVLKKLGGGLEIRHGNLFAGETSGVRFANLDGEIALNGEAVLTIQAGKDRTNLGISLTYATLPPDVYALERRIRAAAGGFKGKGQLSWQVHGRQLGRLDGEVWRQIWARAFSAVEATRCGADQEETTILAHTDLLPGPPGAKNETSPGNLAITRRYDAQAGVTMIILSSPAAVEDY